MNYVLGFLMRGFPFLWIIMGIMGSLNDQYDKAAYDMAAGAFFMIMPMYFAFLDGRD